MDLVFNDERMTDNPALDSQIENEHHNPCKSATCPDQETDLSAVYQKLLQQYNFLSSQYADLAAEYLKLEQAYAGIAVSYERECALELELAQSQKMLAGVLSSLSWRVTAPIRKMMGWLRRRK